MMFDNASFVGIDNAADRSERSRRLWNNRPAAAAPERFADHAFILPRGLGTDFS
jgi:hypothetical protein